MTEPKKKKAQGARKPAKTASRATGGTRRRTNRSPTHPY
jgi:hypothetical protein